MTSDNCNLQSDPVAFSLIAATARLLGIQIEIGIAIEIEGTPSRYR